MTAQPPPEVAAAAAARAEARARRDWQDADRLKSEIEAAGWRVIDAGLRYTLAPSVAPDVVVEGRVLYGSSASVPSRLDAEPVGLATVVLVARDEPLDVERALAGIREHGPDGIQIVVVGNAPSPAQIAALEELEAVDPGSPGIATEVLWTSERLGYAAALNAGIRRAEAPVVIAVEPAIAILKGDVVARLTEALADPAVVIAGPWGLGFADPGSPDFRRLVQAGGDVVALDGALHAFRRSDFVARGPLDEGYRDRAWLDVWWSLVLREHEGGAERPRGALAIEELPVERGREPEGDARLAKRNYYRFLERFRGREREFAPFSPRNGRGGA